MSELYKVANKVVVLMIVPTTLVVSGLAYGALRPIEPAAPPPAAVVAKAPAKAHLDLSKVEVLTTWSVLTKVPAPPAPKAEPKVWTCETRPLFVGRLSDELRFTSERTVTTCGNR
jgi:hypothetical protein